MHTLMSQASGFPVRQWASFIILDSLPWSMLQEWNQRTDFGNVIIMSKVVDLYEIDHPPLYVRIFIFWHEIPSTKISGLWLRANLVSGINVILEHVICDRYKLYTLTNDLLHTLLRTGWDYLIDVRKMSYILSKMTYTYSPIKKVDFK